MKSTPELGIKPRTSVAVGEHLHHSSPSIILNDPDFVALVVGNPAVINLALKPFHQLTFQELNFHKEIVVPLETELIKLFWSEIKIDRFISCFLSTMPLTNPAYGALHFISVIH